MPASDVQITKPDWLEALHAKDAAQRCQAENVLQYYQYVNKNLAEQTVLNERIQLWFHFVAESHTLFQHADEHLDAESIAKLEGYLSTIQFKSIPKFLQTPVAKAKSASIKLKENWKNLTAWFVPSPYFSDFGRFQGDIKEGFTEHCLAPMTDLTADLWQYISKFLGTMTLRCLAQVSQLPPVTASGSGRA